MEELCAEGRRGPRGPKGGGAGSASPTLLTQGEACATAGALARSVEGEPRARRPWDSPALGEDLM